MPMVCIPDEGDSQMPSFGFRPMRPNAPRRRMSSVSADATRSPRKDSRVRLNTQYVFFIQIPIERYRCGALPDQKQRAPAHRRSFYCLHDFLATALDQIDEAD